MFDEDAYEKCLAARAGYSSSRGVVAQAAGASFDALRNHTEHLLDEGAEEQEQQAVDAEKEAEGARSNLDAAQKAAALAGDPGRDDALKAEGATEAELEKAEEAAVPERAEADVARDVVEEVKVKLQGLREDELSR